jgi:hypothetical protein
VHTRTDTVIDRSNIIGTKEHEKAEAAWHQLLDTSFCHQRIQRDASTGFPRSSPYSVLKQSDLDTLLKTIESAFGDRIYFGCGSLKPTDSLTKFPIKL